MTEPKHCPGCLSHLGLLMKDEACPGIPASEGAREALARLRVGLNDAANVVASRDRASDNMQIRAWRALLDATASFDSEEAHAAALAAPSPASGAASPGLSCGEVGGKWLCSLPAGHEAPHEAHGDGGRVLYRWWSEPAPPPAPAPPTCGRTLGHGRACGHSMSEHYLGFGCSRCECGVAPSAPAPTVYPVTQPNLGGMVTAPAPTGERPRRPYCAESAPDGGPGCDLDRGHDGSHRSPRGTRWPAPAQPEGQREMERVEAALRPASAAELEAMDRDAAREEYAVGGTAKCRHGFRTSAEFCQECAAPSPPSGGEPSAEGVDKPLRRADVERTARALSDVLGVPMYPICMEAARWHLKALAGERKRGDSYRDTSAGHVERAEQAEAELAEARRELAALREECGQVVAMCRNVLQGWETPTGYQSQLVRAPLATVIVRLEEALGGSQ